MSRVLIIDDETTLRYLLRQALEYGGYEVADASNGREGLQLCRSVRPDLIITDLAMPELDGFALIDHLRRELPATAIIAMSGSDPLTLEQAQQLGVSCAIQKPFDLWALIETVDELCSNRRTAAAD
jgi:CheY-like chemotaxis protein